MEERMVGQTRKKEEKEEEEEDKKEEQRMTERRPGVSEKDLGINRRSKNVSPK